MICNVDDTETKMHAYKTIEVPEQVDCLQGILTVIPLQLLSLHIAELRNCDVSAYILVKARPMVTYPATEHYRPLASTKLYCM